MVVPFLLRFGVFALAFLCVVPTCTSDDRTNAAKLKLKIIEESLNQTHLDFALVDHLVSFDWPKETEIQARKLLQRVLEREDCQISSDAMLASANGNQKLALDLLPYVESRWSSSDLSERLDYLMMVQLLRVDTDRIRDHLIAENSSPKLVLRINAASALLILDPSNEKAMRTLSQHLQSPDAKVLWRCIDAISRTGYVSVSWADTIRTLQKHDDVRVRLVAAFTLAKLHGINNADPRRIFMDALQRRSVPLPMGFTYSSRPGMSHLVYVMQKLLELNLNDDQINLQLVTIVEKAVSRNDITVAISGLATLGKIGPISKNVCLRAERVIKQEPSLRQFFPSYAETFRADNGKEPMKK